MIAAVKYRKALLSADTPTAWRRGSSLLKNFNFFYPTSVER